MGCRYFVTGADGCLGAWAVRFLLDRGDDVTAFDLNATDHRHRLAARVHSDRRVSLDFRRVVGDIRDSAAVLDAMADCDRVIHLAALQVPFCRADPSGGAAVNVMGTINVFEAAVTHDIQPVSYASSVAVFGTPDDYDAPVLPADAPVLPRTLYGAYKVANEHTASVYAADYGLATVGLRPHTVYGPGRDQGMTSQPTVAIDHAVRGESYSVDYGGTADFQYAPDVARLFIAAADSQPAGEAQVLNLGGHMMEVARFVDRIRAVTGFDALSAGTESLPLPHAVSPGSVAEVLSGVTTTPVDDAIAETARIFASSKLD